MPSFPLTLDDPLQVSGYTVVLCSEGTLDVADMSAGSKRCRFGSLGSPGGGGG